MHKKADVFSSCQKYFPGNQSHARKQAYKEIFIGNQLILFSLKNISLWIYSEITEQKKSLIFELLYSSTAALWVLKQSFSVSANLPQFIKTTESKN